MSEHYGPYDRKIREAFIEALGGDYEGEIPEVFNDSYLDFFVVPDLISEYRRKEPRPIGFAWVDLDGFKAINSEHGHTAADQLLPPYVGIHLPSRGYDRIFRQGDELLLVMPQFVEGPDFNTPEEALYAKLESMRAELVELDPVEVHGYSGLGRVKLEATYGGVIFRPNPDQLQESGATKPLMKEVLQGLSLKAEGLLEEAKKEGKNQVLVETIDSRELVRSAEKRLASEHHSTSSLTRSILERKLRQKGDTTRL